MPEEEVDLILVEAREAMQKSIESLKRDLDRVRTGRANPALLDGVQVDYYGTATPLKQLATVQVPEPRLITVQPFDRGALAEIERGILKADLGLMPSNDGKLIRIPVPELTEERRRELVKQVRKMGEEHKLGVRNARRDSVAMLKDLEHSGDLGEDESRTGQRKVQSLTDDSIAKLDALVKAKEEEILTI
ncbi:MAG: ribosome recycling factor [Myxococcota bacterium]